MKETNESVYISRERKEDTLSFQLSNLLVWVKKFGPTSVIALLRDRRRCWTESENRGLEWAHISPSAIVLARVRGIMTRALAEKDYILSIPIILTCWFGINKSSIREQASWTNEEEHSFREQTNITKVKQDTTDVSIWPATQNSFRILKE